MNHSSHCCKNCPRKFSCHEILQAYKQSALLYFSTFVRYAAAAAKSLQSCLTLATPETAAHQAPPSLGFSRQEHWSGLPFPSPMRESEVAQLCPTLSNPMDCSPPGSSVHGIFQARVLEWVPLPPPKI